MGTELIPYDEDRSGDGPKMAALSDQQRRFVLVLLSTTPDHGHEGRAALAAGYAHSQSGYNLMRLPKIIEAVHEEAAKRVLAASQLGVRIMIEVATDPLHKDRYKAAKDLAAMSGFSPVAKQEIKVDHVDNTSEERIARIVANAQKLGLDPRALLGQVGVVVDAEFTVVEPDAEKRITDEYAVKRIEEIEW